VFRERYGQTFYECSLAEPFISEKEVPSFEASVVVMHQEKKEFPVPVDRSITAFSKADNKKQQQLCHGFNHW